MAANLPSCFSIEFLEQLLKFLVNFTLLKYVKSWRSYGFLITKELIFGFQILDLKDHFSASLSLMKNRKSPGNDGLTKEFYVCFFDEINQFLIEAMNESFNTGQLSTSQRQAAIMLIEKEDKDKRMIKNWRPISLINVDTKIASKVLALRMQTVLASIINYDQAAYVRGRYIGESIRLVSDILDFAEENPIGGMLFSADFEKAFDSIEHPFLLAVLASFGFGPQFIHWVRKIFKNAESCVMNNGHSTGCFPLERGTRQGDPLSAYLSYA